ncbi:MAG: DegT/DnrJ/EryC1/StrS aminotransferase family protein [Ilumatobacteraceae bacterium]
MRADFLPFSPPTLFDEELTEVLDTLRSDWITTGPKTKRFEDDFASYVNSPSALAVSSCTDALQVALAALGVGAGDAVFTTTLTFCSTVHVIEHLGATPVLVDIDAMTLNLSPDRLADAIERTKSEGRLVPKAVIPVHYGGHPCDMNSIDALAAQHGLAIVEDAAHALPASVGDRMIGDPTAPDGVTRAVAFSFYATKNLTTAEGGMLTGTQDFIDEARLWSLHGMSRDAWKRYGQGGSWFYEVVRPGFKCNMTDIQASLGLHQLERLAELQQRRRAVLEVYQEGFADLDSVELPTELPGYRSAWHLYPIRLGLDRLTIDRSAFIDELGRHNIGTSVHFIPVHTHPYYRDRYGYEPTDFPVAWGEFQRLISLPLNPRMTPDDAHDVVEAVREIALANPAG